MTEKNSKVNTWDRSWSEKELRDEIPKWSLASDAGVLSLTSITSQLANVTQLAPSFHGRFFLSSFFKNKGIGG